MQSRMFEGHGKENSEVIAILVILKKTREKIGGYWGRRIVWLGIGVKKAVRSRSKRNAWDKNIVFWSFYFSLWSQEPTWASIASMAWPALLALLAWPVFKVTDAFQSKHLVVFMSSWNEVKLDVSAAFTHLSRSNIISLLSDVNVMVL